MSVMTDNQDLEYNIGDDEKPATIEFSEDNEQGVLQEAELEPAVEIEEPEQSAEPKNELDDYSDKVRKRIDKLTARLRETQRREQAALEYAQSVKQRAEELERQFYRTDGQRIQEAKSRAETQAVALKQIIRKAREEGDFETETEAQERLTQVLFEQRQIQQAEAQAAEYAERAKYAAQQPQQPAYQQPQQQPQVDPRAEEWAERNPWFGENVVMTHAAWGIHRTLIEGEGFDPNSDEYYDELDRRIRDTFPQQFASENKSESQTIRTTKPVRTVAPAARSTGVNNARRAVRLKPSQVAIAKKLGVPLEEYAKYVKE